MVLAIVAEGGVWVQALAMLCRCGHAWMGVAVAGKAGVGTVRVGLCRGDM